MIDLQISLGQVNFTNYLHVTVAKIATPTVIEYEQYFATPFTQLNFVVPNLEPTIYFVTYYDAATTSVLGTIQLQLQVNGLSNDVISERRFYTCGVDMADGATSITDSYLIGKNVVGVFKEGFRYYQPTVEYSFNNVNGQVSILNGTSFSTGEVFCVELYYKVLTTAPTTSNGIYTSTISLSGLTETLTNTDKNKRIRLINNNNGSVKQVINMPSLASLNDEDGFLLDRVDGFGFSQVELVFDGTDRLYYKGISSGFPTYPRFFIGMGEQILIRKIGTQWELILPYLGYNVGERTGVSSSTGQSINYLREDGALYSETQLPRLMYWLRYIFGTYNCEIDDNITNVGWVRPAGKETKFFINNSLTHLRMPDTNVYFRKI